MKKKVLGMLLVAAMAGTLLAGCGSSGGNDGGADSSAAEEGGSSGDGKVLNVASVNNDSMVIMEELSSKYTEETGVEVKFTILSENEIRSKITQDAGLTE